MFVGLDTMRRLAAADATIFPSYGGRFSFSSDDCRDIVAGATADADSLRPCLPVPAGGMSLARIKELLAFYGRDVMFLIGGDLHRHGDLEESCGAFLRLVEAN